MTGDQCCFAQVLGDALLGWMPSAAAVLADYWAGQLALIAADTPFGFAVAVVVAVTAAVSAAVAVAGAVAVAVAVVAAGAVVVAAAAAAARVGGEAAAKDHRQHSPRGCTARRMS